MRDGLLSLQLDSSTWKLFDASFGRALNDNIAQSNNQETSHNTRIILKLLQPKPLGVNFCQILGIEPPTQAAKSMLYLLRQKLVHLRQKLFLVLFPISEGRDDENLLSLDDVVRPLNDADLGICDWNGTLH